MSIKNSQPDLVARRGELMAELFFQELEPVFVSKPTSQDFGYDLLVGFLNEKSGVNTFGVRVKATEQPPGGRLQIPISTISRLVHSNIPGLLLVADVKHSRLYYAWLRPAEAQGIHHVSIKLKEMNEARKHELKRELIRADGGVAVAS